MTIQLKRAYDEVGNDGYRVLVDRMWPRGVAKSELRADEWLKEVAPSDELRKSYHDGSLSWGQFRRRYMKELTGNRDRLRPLARRARGDTVTLLFSSRDEKHNNAEVVRQYLHMLQ